jgi:N-acetylglutamate synthase-like GNAT family acetyltransferase
MNELVDLKNLVIKSPETREEFEKYCDLRWRILRAPLNRPQLNLDDEIKDESVKIIVCEESGNVIGTGRASFNSTTEAQIRSMAVEENYKGKGIGSLIISELEKRVIKLGVKKIVIDSRDTAEKFYEKHGYTATSESYVLLEKIPHIRMIKNFN